MAYFLFLTSCNDESSFTKVLLLLIYLKPCPISHVTISKNGNVIFQHFICIFLAYVGFKLNLQKTLMTKIGSQVEVYQVLRLLNLLDSI